jgi:hypothetical protein
MNMNQKIKLFYSINDGEKQEIHEFTQPFSFSTSDGKVIKTYPCGKHTSTDPTTNNVQSFDALGNIVSEKIHDGNKTIQITYTNTNKIEKVLYQNHKHIQYEMIEYELYCNSDHIYTVKDHYYKLNKTVWDEFRGTVDDEGNLVEGKLLYKRRDDKILSFEGTFYPNGKEKKGISVFSSDETVIESIECEYNEESQPIGIQKICFNEKDERDYAEIVIVPEQENTSHGVLVYKDSNSLNIKTFEGMIYDDTLQPRDGVIEYENRNDRATRFKGKIDQDGHLVEGSLEYEEGQYLSYHGTFYAEEDDSFFDEGYVLYRDDENYSKFTGSFLYNLPKEGEIVFNRSTTGCEMKWKGQLGDKTTDGEFVFIFDNEEEVVKGYFDEKGNYTTSSQSKNLKSKIVETFHKNYIKFLRRCICNLERENKELQKNNNNKRQRESETVVDDDCVEKRQCRCDDIRKTQVDGQSPFEETDPYESD